MRSGNPALTADTFLAEVQRSPAFARAGTMTLAGTVWKTAFLLLVLLATATLAWRQPPHAVGGLITVGIIGGLVFGLVTSFKKNWSPVTAPVYAAAEGLVLGGVSVMFEHSYHGVVVQAALLTLATLFGLLGLYMTGVIRATENFKLCVGAATIGIALCYLASMVLHLLGVQVPFIHQGGVVSIGISLLIVSVAALNLVLDFDFIESGVEAGAPSYMEWYGGFGLLVTLVWLYLEMLRLLVKLQSRD